MPIVDHFLTVTDPRRYNQAHKLIDIIMVAVCGVLAGCETWTEIQGFGETRKDWFKTFLSLDNGVPSHDTFGRVFSLIDPDEFQTSFRDWISEMIPALNENEVVAVDGKTIRRSGHKTPGNNPAAGPLHLVSAYAVGQGVALGQVDVNKKSNEITAIPQLLKLLDIEGCVVTTDAMGCQTKIAETVIDQQADYLLAVKGNQKNLYQNIKNCFAMNETSVESCMSEETGHGRKEKRVCEIITDPKLVAELKGSSNWPGLSTVVKVTSERTVKDRETTTATRYYISSLENPDAKKLLRSVRSHWGIENSLHWVLDTTFKEDESRTRTGNAQANLAVLRHIALNLVKQDTTRTTSIKTSIKKAGWNTKHMQKLLGYKDMQ